MKIKISLQLTITVFILCLLTFVVLSGIVVHFEQKALVTTRDERGKMLVQGLHTLAGQVISAGNVGALIDECAAIRDRYHDVIQVFVIDSTGRIIAHSTPGQIGNQCTNDDCLLLVQQKNLQVRNRHQDKEDVVEFSQPLIINGARCGSISIVMTNMPSRMHTRKLLSFIAISGIIILAINILIMLLVAHRLVSIPVRLLADGMRTVSTGDFNRRLPEKGANDLRQLCALFNRMCSMLFKQNYQIYSLYNTVQAFETGQELATLLSLSMKAVDDFIGTQRCILCLVNKGNLIIKETSGFVAGATMRNKPLILPNEIFVKTVQKQATRKFVVASIKETFDDLNIPLDGLSEEVLIAPLVYGKKTKGIYVLIGKKDGFVFTEADTRYLEIISLVTAMSLFNIQLQEKTAKPKKAEPESVVADVVRRVLMPQQAFKVKGIEVCSYYRPAGDTHGNWHGFIEDKENNRLSVFIGDAPGQGTAAALIVAYANNFIKTMSVLKKRYDKLSHLLYRDTDYNPDQKELPVNLNPSYLLSLFNQVLYTTAAGKHSMTFFASTFDLVKKKIYFANAGHEIPVLIKKAHQLPVALTSSGARLGEKEDVSYDQHILDLASGDVIVWYTAGVPQCLDPSGAPYGTMRFLRKISELSSLSVREICKNLIDDIHTFRRNKSLVDDITLVTAKIL